MPVRINDVVYVHSDASVAITPREGQSEGIPFELRKVKAFEGDLAAGSVHIEGLSLQPEAVAPTIAKPTWSMDLSAIGEAIALAKHIGPGAMSIHCDVMITLQHKNKPSTKIAVVDTLITKGLGGFKSDTGNVPATSIGGNAVNILTDDLDLLNVPAA